MRGGLMSKYIVRDEGISLLKRTFPHIDTDILLSSYIEFKEGFLELLSSTLPFVSVETQDLLLQVEKANRELKGVNTISLDSMYKCDNNIRMSRIYEFGSDMRKFLRLYSSYNGLSLEEQISKIPDGTYTLVDDDGVAKSTILAIIDSLSDGEYLQDKIKENIYYKSNSMMRLISLLPKRITINNVYLLADSAENIYDVVDLRDFIFGVDNSGLMVDNNGVVARAPYISNFIDLTSRASIDITDTAFFSKKICELNYRLFSSIDKTMKVYDLSEDFQVAASWLGVEGQCFVTDACKILGYIA